MNFFLVLEKDDSTLKRAGKYSLVNMSFLIPDDIRFDYIIINNRYVFRQNPEQELSLPLQ